MEGDRYMTTGASRGFGVRLNTNMATVKCLKVNPGKYSVVPYILNGCGMCYRREDNEGEGCKSINNVKLEIRTNIFTCNTIK